MVYPFRVCSYFKLRPKITSNNSRIGIWFSVCRLQAGCVGLWVSDESWKKVQRYYETPELTHSLQLLLLSQNITPTTPPTRCYLAVLLITGICDERRWWTLCSLYWDLSETLTHIFFLLLKNILILSPIKYYKIKTRYTSLLDLVLSVTFHISKKKHPTSDLTLKGYFISYLSEVIWSHCYQKDLT